MSTANSEWIEKPNETELYPPSLTYFLGLIFKYPSAVPEQETSNDNPYYDKPIDGPLWIHIFSCNSFYNFPSSCLKVIYWIMLWLIEWFLHSPIFDDQVGNIFASR